MTANIRTALSLTIAALGLVVLAPAGARADIALQTYEFNGQPGTETSVSTATTATGITGNNFTEANVTPNSGSNSINSAGWNNAGADYSFGFTVQTGMVATVDSIALATRSSGTGPADLLLQASINGGAATTVATITDGNAVYNDEIITFSSALSVTQSVVFTIVTADQNAASGSGTIGSAGTFRVGDYAPSGGTATPFTVNGSISPNVPAVPEPSSVILLGTGLAGMVGFLLRRRAVA